MTDSVPERTAMPALTLAAAAVVVIALRQFLTAVRGRRCVRSERHDVPASVARDRGKGDGDAREDGDGRER